MISCPLEGNPPASYQWYFKKSLDNGSQSDDRILIKQNNYLKLLNNNRTLYFEEFKEENNGRYICTAKNSLGNRTYMDFPQIEVNSE